MRKIILNLAVSLDGYISDENGGFDWIVGHGDNPGTEAYDFKGFMERIDTMVMGSVSYEDVILSRVDSYENKRILVATGRELKREEGVEFIKGDIVQQVVDLKDEEGGDIWLFGGAGLTDEFIRADVIDEYVIAIIPTILGRGRRLFKGDYEKIDLHLDEHIVSDGIPVLTYSRRNCSLK